MEVGEVREAGSLAVGGDLAWWETGMEAGRAAKRGWWPGPGSGLERMERREKN